MTRLVCFQASGATIPKALLYNKTEQGSFFCFSNFSYFKKTAIKSALEQNGQGLILGPRLSYKVGVPHKVLIRVDDILPRTNVTKKIQEFCGNFASLFDVLKVSAVL